MSPAVVDANKARLVTAPARGTFKRSLTWPQRSRQLAKVDVPADDVWFPWFFSVPNRHPMDSGAAQPIGEAVATDHDRSIKQAQAMPGEV